MAKITKSYDSVIDLTVFMVESEVTFDEVWDQTRIFFDDKPSKLALWDFSSGALAPMSNQEAEEVAMRGSKILAKIEGGKAALLAPNDIDYGMARVFEMFSEMENFPLEIQVFRDMNTAHKWLIPDQ